MSQIQTLRKQVLQLRQEANINRIPVSQACEDCINTVLPIKKLGGDSTKTALIIPVEIEETRTSLFIKHLMKFCLEHQKSDVLVYGISQSENPFKENKGCVLL